MGKQVSLHGRRAYVTERNEIAGSGGVVAGGPQDEHPLIIYPSPNNVAIFDDFLGDLIGDEWAVVESDTGAVTAGALTTATNGVLRLSNEITPLNAPTENIALTQGSFRNWKAGQGAGKEGYIRVSARVKFESVSRTVKRQHVFVGFNDTGTTAFPAYDTGVGIISLPQDYVGIMFSPGGDTGFVGVAAKGVAGDSGDQVVALTTAAADQPAANKYYTLSTEVRRNSGDTGLTAFFYVDGKIKGSIASPVQNATDLSPWIGYWAQDTGSRYMDIDYVNVAGARDTGL